MSQPPKTNQSLCGICHKPISITHSADTEIIMNDDYIGCPNEHLFHRECIQTWLLNSKECPLCYEQFDNEILESIKDFKRQVEMQKEAEAELERQMKEEELREKNAAEQQKREELNQTLQQGTRLFEKKKYKEAINLYWDYIDSHNLKKGDKDYHVILFALSLIYYNMTKYGLAVQQLSLIVQEDPSFPKAFNYLEKCYEELGMADKARWARERISNSREFSQSDFFYGASGAQQQVKTTTKQSQSELERIISVVYSDNPFFAELNPDGQIPKRRKRKAKKITNQLFEEKEEQVTVEELAAEAESGADVANQPPQANVMEELGIGSQAGPPRAPPTTKSAPPTEPPKASLPPRLHPPSHLKPPPTSKSKATSVPTAKSPSASANGPPMAPSPKQTGSAQMPKAEDPLEKIKQKPKPKPLAVADKEGREINNALKIECMAAKIDSGMSYPDLVNKIQELDFQLKELRTLLDELGEAFLGDDSMDLDSYMEQEARIKGQIDDFDDKVTVLKKLKAAKYD